jgi:hypothetical protein
LDLWFKSYEGFKISSELRACWKPMQQNLPKIAQNCQNLPKDKTLKYHQKLRFECFLKIKFCMCRRGIRACFYCPDFNPRIFHMLFLLSENGLCMWISAYPFVQNDIFFKVPWVSWIWDFVDMYITYLGTRIWSPSIHTYSIKMVFLASKTLLYPLSIGKKAIFFNFEPYDLANSMEWVCKIWWTYKHIS